MLDRRLGCVGQVKRLQEERTEFAARREMLSSTRAARETKRGKANASAEEEVTI